MVATTLRHARRDPAAAAAMAMSLPAMHLPWGVGFIVGLVSRRPRQPRT